MKTVAYLDVVATRGEDSVFIHIANRSFDRDFEVEINGSPLGVGNGAARMRILEGLPEADVARERSWVRERSETLQVNDGRLSCVIGKRTVTFVEVPLKR